LVIQYLIAHSPQRGCLHKQSAYIIKLQHALQHFAWHVSDTQLLGSCRRRQLHEPPPRHAAQKPHWRQALLHIHSSTLHLSCSTYAFLTLLPHMHRCIETVCGPVCTHTFFTLEAIMGQQGPNPNAWWHATMRCDRPSVATTHLNVTIVIQQHLSMFGRPES